MPFTAGMNVRLNTGGPRMTIEAVDGDSVNCVWFDKATLRKATFLACMIEDADHLKEILGGIEEEKKAIRSRDSSATGK
jgi:uncharacterized protein YodC (DUF2158 family)